ncbi:MAG: hypothetical protein NTV93_04450 [Verrucomicrobia bacterium]|nr:hypothetical protein [Verrucomicrobiota bacterium]
MSYAEIEAQLDQMPPEELRRIALKSWTTFQAKESGGVNECDEFDPQLLSALDEAIRSADATPDQGHSARQARTRLQEWISR